MKPVSISYYKNKIEHELFESVLPFWAKNSLDNVNGGFYNCLDREGKVYDTRKHVWLQGRQTWMFSKLYNTVHKDEKWLSIAEIGAKFLLEKTIREDCRVYFSVTEDGKGLWMQRKIFSECFWIMALAEYSRASGEESYLIHAENLLEKVWKWSSDLRLVGQPQFEGAKPMNQLAIPMILLNLIEEISNGDLSRYQSKIEECVRLIKLHVNEDRKIVFENVAPDGSIINDIDGRLLNPGHAIEAGWFLQHWAQRLGNEELSQLAINMVRWSHSKGWDNEFGGLFYFLDSEGHSPTQLEWDMKLWWPHTEAMYAHLLNYSLTNSTQDFKLFEQVVDYSFEHFSDPEYGEWFGYLNRRGDKTHTFKGGPYKGCFHVPRGLFLCWELLRKIEKNQEVFS
jgi:N-acylglucosamine 2-epimerase